MIVNLFIRRSSNRFTDHTMENDDETDYEETTPPSTRSLNLNSIDMIGMARFVPKPKIVAFFDALSNYKDKLEMMAPRAPTDDDVDEISKKTVKLGIESIPAIMLGGGKGILDGIRWFVAHVENAVREDEEARSALYQDDALWSSLLAIAVYDPALSCGKSHAAAIYASDSNEGTFQKKGISPYIPTNAEMRDALFYSKEYKTFLTRKDARSEIMSKVIDDKNIFYFYLKHLLRVHSSSILDETSGKSTHTIEIPCGHLRQDAQKDHPKKWIREAPLWSHLDAFSDGFDNTSGIGMSRTSAKTPIATVAAGGFWFVRKNVMTGNSMHPTVSRIALPIDPIFLGEEYAKQSSMTQRYYTIGSPEDNEKYAFVWERCTKPFKMREHVKERIKANRWTDLYAWHASGARIQMPKDLRDADAKLREQKRAFTERCKPIPSDAMEPEGRWLKTTPMMDATVEEAVWQANEAQCHCVKNVAHFFVVKEGSVLCLLENTDATSNDDDVTMMVLLYKFSNKDPKKCRVQALGRFNLSTIFEKKREGLADFDLRSTFEKQTTTKTWRAPAKGVKRPEKSRMRTPIHYRDWTSPKKSKNATVKAIRRIVDADVSVCYLKSSKNDGHVGVALSFVVSVDTFEKKQKKGKKKEETTWKRKSDEIKTMWKRKSDEIVQTTLFISTLKKKSEPSSPPPASITDASTTRKFSIKSACITRMDKQHVWYQRSSFSKAKNGRDLCFFDPKTRRLTIEQKLERPMKSSVVFSATLGDHLASNQSDTLLWSWTHTYLRPKATYDTDSNRWVSDLKGKRTPMITHDRALTCHCVPGPFGGDSKALVLGNSYRYPWENSKTRMSSTLMLKMQTYDVSKNGEKRMGDKTVTCFDTYSPTTSFPLYREQNTVLSNYDAVHAKNNAIDPNALKMIQTIDPNDETMITLSMAIEYKDKDLSFDWDKVFIVRNALVGLTDDHDALNVRVFRFKIGEERHSMVVPKTNDDNDGDENENVVTKHETRPTEAIYLINASTIVDVNDIERHKVPMALPSPNAIPPSPPIDVGKPVWEKHANPIAPPIITIDADGKPIRSSTVTIHRTRSLLGETFETDDHIVLMVKQRVDIARMQTKKLSKSSQTNEGETATIFAKFWNIESFLEDDEFENQEKEEEGSKMIEKKSIHERDYVEESRNEADEGDVPKGSVGLQIGDPAYPRRRHYHPHYPYSHPGLAYGRNRIFRGRRRRPGYYRTGANCGDENLIDQAVSLMGDGNVLANAVCCNPCCLKPGCTLFAFDSSGIKRFFCCAQCAATFQKKIGPMLG